MDGGMHREINFLERQWLACRDEKEFYGCF